MKKVEEFIIQHSLIQEGDKIVAGISGGADSICLFYMLKELQKKISFEFVAVHIHHGIRGQEADEDADFVEKISQKENIKAFVFRYDIKEIAKEEKISEEEAGRKKRYEAFEEVRRNLGYNKIAVAHNKNDQAETVLWNLSRGSGIRGMCGILPLRDRVIRPLLNTERKEIEEYLKTRKISYQQDSTNSEEIYTRNKIRKTLLPFLEKEINQGAVEHIVQASNQFQEVYEYLQLESKAHYDRMIQRRVDSYSTEIRYAREEFHSLPQVIKKELIFMAVEELAGNRKNIGTIHIQSILELSTKEVGKEIKLPKGISVKMEYKFLLFAKTTEEKKGEFYRETVSKAPCELEFFLEKYEKSIIIPEKRYTKWFDYDKIKCVLELRNRMPKDYITINQEMGKKKLKSYFIDSKIPSQDRDRIPLLADGSHIVWIIGYRISEYYKVTEQTKNILKVKVVGGLEDE